MPPALKEPTTGLTMGESAEKMAQENGITREAQDAFAHREPPPRRRRVGERQVRRRGDARRRCRRRYERVAAKDNIVRKDTTLEALAQLRPVFDRRYGTITAGQLLAAHRRRRRARCS